MWDNVAMQKMAAVLVCEWFCRLYAHITSTESSWGTKKNAKKEPANPSCTSKRRGDECSERINGRSLGYGWCWMTTGIHPSSSSSCYVRSGILPPILTSQYRIGVEVENMYIDGDCDISLCTLPVKNRTQFRIVLVASCCLFLFTILGFCDKSTSKDLNCRQLFKSLI